MLTGRLLNELIPHTVDVDIANAMFTIVIQLVDLIGPFNFIDEELVELATFSSWRRCASDRPFVLRKIYDLIGDSVNAKELLVSIGNGASLPEALQSDDFFSKLRKESILLRWIACTQMPEAYAEAQEKSKSEWPEATTFFLWWTGAEDAILESMMRNIRIVGDRISHLSLHFDGFRLDKTTFDFLSDATTQNENWLHSLQDAVKEDTGFAIKLKVKTSKTLFDMLFDIEADDSDGLLVPSDMTTDGMCIPCSVGVLVGDYAKVHEALVGQHMPYKYNIFAKINQAAGCQDDKVCFVPSLGLNISQPCSYIIHS